MKTGKVAGILYISIAYILYVDGIYPAYVGRRIETVSLIVRTYAATNKRKKKVMGAEEWTAEEWMKEEKVEWFD